MLRGALSTPFSLSCGPEQGTIIVTMTTTASMWSGSWWEAEPACFQTWYQVSMIPWLAAQDRRLDLKVWTLDNYSSRDWEFSAISDSVWMPGSNQSALDQHGITTTMGTKSELWQKLLVCSQSMFPLFFQTNNILNLFPCGTHMCFPSRRASHISVTWAKSTRRCYSYPVQGLCSDHCVVS